MSEVADVVQQYVTASAPLANQIIGKVTRTSQRRQRASGEIPSGDVIADAQLVATNRPTGGAQIAFMNPGGIRGGATNGFLFTPSGAEAPGEVTYGEAFTIQPFGNSLVTKTMTGAQITSCSSSSGLRDARRNVILQISAGFTLHRDGWAPASATGSPGLALNGRRSSRRTYRVTMNNFLAGGGDGFTVFTQGTDLAGAVRSTSTPWWTTSLPTPHRAGEPDHRHLITRTGRPARDRDTVTDAHDELLDLAARSKRPSTSTQESRGGTRPVQPVTRAVAASASAAQQAME